MSCGPGLATMLENFPLTEVLPKVFRGSGDCSESAWTLLGLTIADWSLLWFVILSAATMYILFARRFRPLPCVSSLTSATILAVRKETAVGTHAYAAVVIEASTSGRSI